ncbi:pilus assembly protein, partial [Salmonella enterica subsp. enterica serovar Ohio]
IVGLSSDSLRRADGTEKWNGVNWMTFNSIVGLSSDSLRRADGTEKWNGVNWMTFNSNDALDIVLTGVAQNVTADTYPITVDVVGYQP